MPARPAGAPPSGCGLRASSGLAQSGRAAFFASSLPLARESLESRTFYLSSPRKRGRGGPGSRRELSFFFSGRRWVREGRLRQSESCVRPEPHGTRSAGRGEGEPGASLRGSAAEARLTRPESCAGKLFSSCWEGETEEEV